MPNSNGHFAFCSVKVIRQTQYERRGIIFPENFFDFKKELFPAFSFDCSERSNRYPQLVANGDADSLCTNVQGGNSTRPWNCKSICKIPGIRCFFFLHVCL